MKETSERKERECATSINIFSKKLTCCVCVCRQYTWRVPTAGPQKVSGLDSKSLAALLALDLDECKGHNRGNAMASTLKMCIREGRQSGIHVSPTCLVNGIVVDTSSSWTMEQWGAFLAPLMPEK